MTTKQNWTVYKVVDKDGDLKTYHGFELSDRLVGDTWQTRDSEKEVVALAPNCQAAREMANQLDREIAQ